MNGRLADLVKVVEFRVILSESCTIRGISNKSTSILGNQTVGFPKPVEQTTHNMKSFLPRTDAQTLYCLPMKPERTASMVMRQETGKKILLANFCGIVITVRFCLSIIVHLVQTGCRRAVMCLWQLWHTESLPRVYKRLFLTYLDKRKSRHLHVWNRTPVLLVGDCG